jgi:biopolymer transport protein ExbD
MARARRALALTPLIDVIFLLLMFFMLTTTFGRPVELPLSLAGGGAVAEARPLLLELTPEGATLAGAQIARADMAATLAATLAGEALVVIRLAPEVTAQDLMDLLAILNGIAGLSVRVL